MSIHDYGDPGIAWGEANAANDDGQDAERDAELARLRTENTVLGHRLRIAVSTLEEFSNGGHGDLCALDAQGTLDAINAAQATGHAAQEVPGAAR